MEKEIGMTTRTSCKQGSTPTGAWIELAGARFYAIRNYDRMTPFFISLVSSSDHWLFASSTGALTAGRGDPDTAIFPYQTEDKLVDTRSATGSVCVLFVGTGQNRRLWEPFSEAGMATWRVERRLCKSLAGTRLIFEETNIDLDLTYRYGWRFSDKFGVVRDAELVNFGDVPVEVEILDGVQNILPYGVTTASYEGYSNLLDAYKRSELVAGKGPAIYAMTAGLTDRPVPSESQKATTAWQVGLPTLGYLLSTRQLADFRNGEPIVQEDDTCGRRGAFLTHAAFELPPGDNRHWLTVLDVNADACDVVRLANRLGSEAGALVEACSRDAEETERKLVVRVAASDGLQSVADPTVSAHHFANVMFNLMRGGAPVAGYQIGAHAWAEMLRQFNAPAAARAQQRLQELPPELDVVALRAWADTTGAADLARLARQYLPLTFGRRHGDPSRPWNRFSIRIRNADGTPRCSYQGNWRDIFQNWEALGLAYPCFVENFIAVFLCATTADGYNPYRVTSEGIDWEVPAPDSPWSGFGYWGDHQIIYLLRLLKLEEQFCPGALGSLLDRPIFGCADVPYRIKTYSDILKNPRDTVTFDAEQQKKIEARIQRVGFDGRLHSDGNDAVRHVTLAEKLITLILAKMANFVPGGGIWMNTQRPEWNDANNALAGYGLSVVTTCYLRRYVAFLLSLFEGRSNPFVLTEGVATWLDRTSSTLTQFVNLTETDVDDAAERKSFMDAMGEVGSRYRETLYRNGIASTTRAVPAADVKRLLQTALIHIDHCIRRNRRDDGLFHAYNVLKQTPEGASVGVLHAMLEGQVAVLSSGLLDSAESLKLLEALRASAMYRADQHTYMLYPRRMPGRFMERNLVPADDALAIPLIRRLLDGGDTRLVLRDENGGIHFNGAFRNSACVMASLNLLAQEPAYRADVAAYSANVLDLYEATFHHREYTGRSGSMFAYEGIGSIYWHMVSKLLLAAQEAQHSAEANGAPEAEALAVCYDDIRAGLGFNKTPAEFGAFPTDPYSHTPWGAGAKQPGMTGQVKEELITRLEELGVSVSDGCILFRPGKVGVHHEYHEKSDVFRFFTLEGEAAEINLPPNSLAFTLCQTPVLYIRDGCETMQLALRNGLQTDITGTRLDAVASASIFQRTGEIRQITVHAGAPT